MKTSDRLSWLRLGILAALILSMALIASCSSFGNWLSKSIYPNLQVAYDNEPPATPTFYTPSAQLSGVLGGQAGGISCSIPWQIKPLFFQRTGNNADVNLQFRLACSYHDLCYRHGWATYGYSQADCDFALQENAFRLCRLISLPANSSGVARQNALEACRDRARKVLLGVRFGGGKSFKAGSDSTYFEFDPMPVRADNFGVVRWLKGEAGHGHNLRGSFRHLQYNHGRVSEKAVPGSDISIVAAYPRANISTPPYIVLTGTYDHLYAASRQGSTNTEVDLLELTDIPTVRTKTLEEVPNIEVVLKQVGALDADTSVMWPASSASGVRMTYWCRYSESIRSCDSSVGNSCVSCAVRAGSVLQDTYRTLQQSPIAGDFSSAKCPQYAVLRRGGDPGNQAVPDSRKGAGFEQELGVILVRDPNADPTRIGDQCPSAHQPLLLRASEDVEPLSAIEGSTGKDQLVGMLTDSHHADRLVVMTFDLTQPQPVSPVTWVFETPNQIGLLTKEWARRGVSILRSNVLGDHTAHMVFTRFRHASNTHPSRPATLTTGNDQMVYLDMLDYKLDLDSTRTRDSLNSLAGSSEHKIAPASGLTCSINLRKQSDVDILSTAGGYKKVRDCGVNCGLLAQVSRAYPECEISANDQSSQLSRPVEWKGCAKRIENSVFGEFAERWANGIAIPGAFSTAENDARTSVRSLEVAFFFRGRTAYAFMSKAYAFAPTDLREKAPEMPISGLGANAKNFVSCGPYKPTEPPSSVAD